MAIHSKYEQFLIKMNNYSESIEELKRDLITLKKDYKKLDSLNNKIIHELETGVI